MTELRQDPTTKQWVIIATERARRPQDFVQQSISLTLPPYKADCPFCPGNERAVAQIILAMVLGLRYKDGKDND